MFEVLFWILVGAFLGWHFPEPFWAKLAKEKIVKFFKSFKA